jgi:hypothetical protein
MVFSIEIFNDTTLDLLRNLEKLHLIKLSDTATSTKGGTSKSRKRLTDEALIAKINEGEASGISYQFKGNEFNKLGDMLLKGQAVDWEKYKIVDQ